ncbi:MAG: RNA chaperone Hfq [Eubacteriales bacterium]|nr:RNA chaperone Hfq [Eubacteriales bacterium]
MKNEINLQDTFLNKARQEKVPLTVFLTNGFQLRGIVRGFDAFIVLFDCDGKQEMIYKHAISTVIPQRRLDMSGRKDAASGS